MLKITRLKKRHISPCHFQFLKNTLYAIASRHFQNVPPEDIDQLLNDVATNSGVVYIIRDRKKTVGFGAGVYRNIQGKKVIELEAGCVDAEIRGQHILNLLSVREILRFKLESIQNLCQTIYAVAICMSPQGYLVYQMLETWSDPSNIPKKYYVLYDAFISAYCRELQVDYSGCGKPIHFTTWIPTTVKTSDLNNQNVKYFLEKNPNWENGNGLPIVIPIGWRTTFYLIKISLLSKLYLGKKTA